MRVCVHSGAVQQQCHDGYHTGRASLRSLGWPATYKVRLRSGDRYTPTEGWKSSVRESFGGNQCSLCRIE